MPNPSPPPILPCTPPTGSLGGGPVWGPNRGLTTRARPKASHLRGFTARPAAHRCGGSHDGCGPAHRTAPSRFGGPFAVGRNGLGRARAGPFGGPPARRGTPRLCTSMCLSANVWAPGADHAKHRSPAGPVRPRPSQSTELSSDPPKGMQWDGGRYPPAPPLQGAEPMPSHCLPDPQLPASMVCVTDSNRPQPLRQPPPTACQTASGAASEAPSLVPHPCPWVSRRHGLVDARSSRLTAAPSDSGRACAAQEAGLNPHLP